MYLDIQVIIYIFFFLRNENLIENITICAHFIKNFRDGLFWIIFISLQFCSQFVFLPATNLVKKNKAFGFFFSLMIVINNFM